jgi:RNA polymerase sigma-70 factor, ECF subfamily
VWSILRRRSARPGAGSAALLSLPEAFRMAVYYADVEGSSYAEIAAIMGTSKGTVISRLHRGRTRLRELLFGLAPERGVL